MSAFLSTLLYLLIFIFVLGIVVLVHEFGHFLFARRAGILCHEFSIGMGPLLFKIKRGETVYAIRAIPIGGYVSMAGEDPESDKIKKGQEIYLYTEGNLVKNIYLYKPEIEENKYIKYAKVIDFDLYGKDDKKLYIHYEDEKNQTHFVNVANDAFYNLTPKQEMQIAPYNRCFESKSWINRFLTVVAGASFNFLLAILVFIVINLFSGVPVNKPIIGDISKNSPAAIQGLQKDDLILSINSKEVKSWNEISAFMYDYEGGEITLVVSRNGEEKFITVTPEFYIATIGIKSTNDIANSTVISGVSPNSPASKEGIKKGDIITRIEGTVSDDPNTNENEAESVNVNVNNWYDINNTLEKFYLGENINLYIIRNNNPEPIKINIKAIKALNSDNVSQGLIGISQKTEFNPIMSVVNGFKQTGSVIASVFKTIDLLINDRNVSASDLSGPVGIFDMTKTFAMAGFLALLGWTAFISANIGFVNLLPFPALDGGRLIFLLIEAIARRPINRKIEGYIHIVGFILFMLLFVFITFNDILRIRG